METIFKEIDFNWVGIPIIGMALLIQGGSIDSHNNKIEQLSHYKVGKHKTTGKVIIHKLPKKDV